MSVQLTQTEPVVSTKRTSPEISHTIRECPHFPSETRPVEDYDKRRGVVRCQWCSQREEK